MAQGSIPGLRSITQPKSLDRLVLQAALVQVRQSCLPGRRVAQLVGVKCDRSFQQGALAVMLFGGGLLCWRRRLQLHPGFLGQKAQRLGEIPALFLHDKAEDIAALVALSKAAPGTCLRKNYESWRAR